jgi:predicted N-acetyltransferase YhbS
MLRPAKKTDIEEMIRVQSAAFKYETNEDRRRHLREELLHSLDGWLVMPGEGRLIGVVLVRNHRMRIGKSVILKGDVGEVAIHPDFQGQGYGHKIMEECLEWMKENRYDLSRLGGLVKFYRRFGYLRFPRRYMEFPVGKVVGAGAARVKEGQIEIPREWAGNIRPYNPKKDFSGYARICRRMTASYNGAMDIPSRKTDNPGPSPLYLVYEEKGKIIAFVQAGQTDWEPTEFEARINIGYSGFLKGKAYGLAAILEYLYNYALKNQIERMTGRIPFDPEFLLTLTQTPLRFYSIETYGGLSGNMLQIINIQSLFERLMPELQERLKPSAWNGILNIGIEKDKVQLAIHDSKIKVVENKKPTLKIKLTEFQLLGLVIGILSFEEISNPKLKPQEKAMLSLLFPRRPVFSGIWG